MRRFCFASFGPLRCCFSGVFVDLGGSPGGGCGFSLGGTAVEERARATPELDRHEPFCSLASVEVLLLLLLLLLAEVFFVLLLLVETLTFCSSLNLITNA